MRRRRSGEKYRSLGEDDFSSEDGGPLPAFRMTIFPDGNREVFSLLYKRSFSFKIGKNKGQNYIILSLTLN